MFNTTNTTNCKKNISNAARYLTAHKKDDNEFLFACQYVIGILKDNADGLTKRTFQRCWNNMLEVIHRNIMNRGERMVEPLIQILTAENKAVYTKQQIADIVKYGSYISTVGVGENNDRLTDFSILFKYDGEEVILKFE